MSSVFLFNVGLDMSVWAWVVLVGLCLVAATVFGFQAYKLIALIRSGADRNAFQYQRDRKRAIIRTSIAGIIAVLLLLACFGAYGAGEPPAVETGRGEAIHNNAPKEPTKKQLKKDSENKKDPELKKQKGYHKRADDPSDKTYRDDADEYERRALKRNNPKR
ncbi:MAG: hypothetical protein GTN71_05760 [Anaerolineae bacterium]|nr:hypothetical protein [Anaerolineae bacterium]